MGNMDDNSASIMMLYGNQGGDAVTDYFTDTDGVTLPNHTPTRRPGTNAWVAGTGTWDIIGNQASMDSGGTTFNNAYIDAGVSGGDVECSVTTSATADRYTGLVVRASATNSNWEIFINAQTDTLYINDNDAGTRTTRASGAVTISASTTYTLRVNLSGNNITGYVNDVQIATFTSTFNNTATSHGLFQWDNVTDPRWDNFRVY